MSHDKMLDRSTANVDAMESEDEATRNNVTLEVTASFP